jgi:pyruvate, orthophosphate dikinase
MPKRPARPARAAKYVYFFGNGKADGDRTMKDLLGGKGSGLAEMTNAGLPVPPGFTISTAACTQFYEQKRKTPEAVDAQMIENLRKLEKAVGKKLGDANDPLLVSVRSGAKFSMPGMMDTILNLGMNDRTVEAIKARTGNGRFAWDSYRRFIQMFGNVVLEIPKDAFEHTLDAVKKENGASVDTELTEANLQEVVRRYKDVVREKTGKSFPQDPLAQLRGARDAVFRSWNNARAIEYRRIYEIPDSIGTAVNVQAMVFGNMGDRSATGVGFTRNPATGANEFYGEFLVNAQGEDVVSGVRTPQPIAELEQVLPTAYKELRTITSRLEKHYKDVQDFEFTIEDDRLYMLQTRNGKRTGYAAVMIATDLVAEKLITPKEAVLQVDPESVSQLLAPVFEPKAWKALPVTTKGLPASPGRGVGPGGVHGRPCRRVDARREEGRPRPEGNRARRHPRDVRCTGDPDRDGRDDVACGGRRPADGQALGRRRRRARDQRGLENLQVGGHTIKEGDYVSFDGLTGEVKVGQVATKPSEILQVVAGEMKKEQSDVYRRFEKLLSWADKYRRLGIRANADQPDQAETAYAFGARGIGLCRTEHMFFGEGRIPIVQRMILADNEADRRAALDELLPLQREDFYGVFKAMHGEPVTIRTIDPPLHEFLPKREDLMVDIARMEERGTKGKPLDEKHALLRRVEQLHEFNPMLGHRGVRLGITYPEITEMQTRAILEAACQLAKEGIRCVPEIMIPLVGHVKELRDQKAVVDRVAQDVMKAQGVRIKYLVGTMIEVPRGAVTADEIAGEAQFFSFGTNDLTQLTFGFSRDDIGKFLGRLPGQEDPRQGSVRDDRHRRRRHARRDGLREGARGTARSQARDLRRARRRPVVDPLLREREARLRQLLTLPDPGCPAGGGAGGAGGQGRGLITIYVHEEGSTRSADRVDPAWLAPGAGGAVGRPEQPDPRRKPHPQRGLRVPRTGHRGCDCRNPAPEGRVLRHVSLLILHGIDFQASRAPLPDAGRRLLPGPELSGHDPWRRIAVDWARGGHLRTEQPGPGRRARGPDAPHHRHDGRQLPARGGQAQRPAGRIGGGGVRGRQSRRSRGASWRSSATSSRCAASSFRSATSSGGWEGASSRSSPNSWRIASATCTIT